MTGIPEIDKKKKILDRSRALFLQRGISSLSMEQIASLQGISKKTLYRHFPNKEALVTAAVEERITELGRRILALSRSTGFSYLERIREILRVVSRQLAELGAGLIKDLYYNEPQLWERIDTFRQDTVFTLIAKLLKQGMKAGYIHKDIDHRLVPSLFVNALNAVLNPTQFVTLTIPPVEVFDAFIRILFGGILTEEARQRFFEKERGT